MPAAHILGVARGHAHGVGKVAVPRIRLIAGLGVEDDVHAGVAVKHRSRAKKDPTLPNLRQVHLIHAELFADLAAKGFTVAPAGLGENVTTAGVALLALPQGTRLHLGGAAIVEITGLRNPCVQLEGLAEGLMAALLDRAPDGSLIRLAGVMAIVIAGGEVAPGDPIRVELPPEPHVPLVPV